jgi:hypothetical protein
MQKKKISLGTGGVAQVVEHPQSKHKALNSNPSALPHHTQKSKLIHSARKMISICVDLGGYR